MVLLPLMQLKRFVINAKVVASSYLCHSRPTAARSWWPVQKQNVAVLGVRDGSHIGADPVRLTNTRDTQRPGLLARGMVLLQYSVRIRSNLPDRSLKIEDILTRNTVLSYYCVLLFLCLQRNLEFLKKRSHSRLASFLFSFSKEWSSMSRTSLRRV